MITDEIPSLIEAPAIDSPVWNCIQGLEIREYYSQSPFASIIAYRVGFVVCNIVTGGKHPVANWEAAKSLRENLVLRYKSITNSRF